MLYVLSTVIRMHIMKTNKRLPIIHYLINFNVYNKKNI